MERAASETSEERGGSTDEEIEARRLKAARRMVRTTPRFLPQISDFTDELVMCSARRRCGTRRQPEKVGRRLALARPGDLSQLAIPVSVIA